MDAHGSINCADFDGNPVVCPGPDAGSDTFSASLASIGFNTGADLFAVTVGINGPTMSGAGCHTPIAPTDIPCSPGGQAFYDATVSGGDYVRAVGVEVDFPGIYPDPGYVYVPAEYHADSGEAGINAHTFWPDERPDLQTRVGTGLCYLINPSPTWPVPDVVGNTFGMCLFTLAQLPGAIDTTISYYNWEQDVEGQLTVGVSAYNINDGFEVRRRRGCVVGSA